MTTLTTMGYGDITPTSNGQLVLFGEIALTTKEPRSASVRALGYCDLYVLDSAGFQRVLTNPPDAAATIREVADERLSKDRARS